HTCETCGREWPENYCPECAHTIGRAATQAVPPPLPPPVIAQQRGGKSPITRLFGIFKQRAPEPDPAAPHPHHRNFARMFIPVALSGNRGGFLAAMCEPQANQSLQEAWHKCGARVLPPELLAPSAGLSVSAFHHEKFVCLLI